MAGLDDLLGGILGGGGPDQGGTPQPGLAGLASGSMDLNKIMMIVGPMIAAFAASGGLKDLMGKLTSGGLGAQSSSWVGTGANEPVSPEQIEAALPDEVAQIAAQTGMSQADVSASLSELLPGLVDKLSPNGELPTDSSGAQELLGQLPDGNALAGLFPKG